MRKIEGYSNQSKLHAQERIEQFKYSNHDEMIIRKQKIQQLSSQTNQIRRKLEEKKKATEHDEEKRRAEILRTRKLKQKIATEKYQRTKSADTNLIFKQPNNRHELKDGRYDVRGHIIEIKNGVRVASTLSNYPVTNATPVTSNHNNIYSAKSYLNQHLNSLINENLVENNVVNSMKDTNHIIPTSHCNQENSTNEMLARNQSRFETAQAPMNDVESNQFQTIEHSYTKPQNVAHIDQYIRTNAPHIGQQDQLHRQLNNAREYTSHNGQRKSPTDSLDSNDSLNNSGEQKLLKSSLKGSSITKLKEDSFNRKVRFSGSIEFNDGNKHPLVSQPQPKIPLFKKMKMNKHNGKKHSDIQPTINTQQYTNTYQNEDKQQANDNKPQHQNEDKQHANDNKPQLTTEQLLDKMRQDVLLPKYPKNNDYSYPESIVTTYADNVAVVSPIMSPYMMEGNQPPNNSSLNSLSAKDSLDLKFTRQDNNNNTNNVNNVNRSYDIPPGDSSLQKNNVSPIEDFISSTEDFATTQKNNISPTEGYATTQKNNIYPTADYATTQKNNISPTEDYATTQKNHISPTEGYATSSMNSVYLTSSAMPHTEIPFNTSNTYSYYSSTPLVTSTSTTSHSVTPATYPGVTPATYPGVTPATYLTHQSEAKQANYAAHAASETTSPILSMHHVYIERESSLNNIKRNSSSVHKRSNSKPVQLRENSFSSNNSDIVTSSNTTLQNGFNHTPDLISRQTSFTVHHPNQLSKQVNQQPNQLSKQVNQQPNQLSKQVNKDNYHTIKITSSGPSLNHFGENYSTNKKDYDNKPRENTFEKSNENGDEIYNQVENSLAGLTFETTRKSYHKRDEEKVYSQVEEGRVYQDSTYETNEVKNNTVNLAIKQAPTIPLRFHGSPSVTRRGRIIVSADSKKRRHPTSQFSPRPPPAQHKNKQDIENNIAHNIKSLPNKPPMVSKTLQNRAAMASRTPPVFIKPNHASIRNRSFSANSALNNKEKIPNNRSRPQSSTNTRSIMLRPQNNMIHNHQQRTLSHNSKSSLRHNSNPQLNKTPTDDEINRLWDNVRECLHSDTSSEHAFSDSYCLKEQLPRKSYERRLSDSNVIHSNHSNGHFYQNKTPLSTTVIPYKRYGSQDHMMHRQLSNDSMGSDSSYTRRHALLPNRATKVIQASINNHNSPTAPSVNNRHKPSSPAIRVKPSSSHSTANMSKYNGVSESMASFLTLEELCVKQSLTPRQAEAVFQTSKHLRHPRNSNNYGMTALSIEERCVMESLDRINNQLKEKGVIATMNYVDMDDGQMDGRLM